jgi:hypothetical protein
MRTVEEYAALRVARANESAAWDALMASDMNDPCNNVWDAYSTAARIKEELEELK